MQCEFIVLEGIDATGKSTVAKILAQKGLPLIESPIEPFLEKQAVIERGTPFANFLFFMATNTQIASLVRKNRSAKATICVRYVWSSIAYHVALGGIKRREATAFWKIFSHKFQLPNLVVFLHTSDFERERRFATKKDPTFQMKLQKNKIFQKRLIREYSFARKLIYSPSTDIDTTSVSPQMVAEKLLNLIRYRV